MINKDGKLFGFVNAFDFFLLLIILGNIFFLGKNYLNQEISIVKNETDFEIILFTEQVPEFVAENIKINDKLIDEVKNSSLGTVYSVELSDAYDYVADSKGLLHKAAKEGYNSTKIVARLKAAPLTGGGFEVNGNKYYIGYGFTCITGKGKIYTRISSINSL